MNKIKIKEHFATNRVETSEKKRDRMYSLTGVEDNKKPTPLSPIKPSGKSKQSGKAKKKG